MWGFASNLANRSDTVYRYRLGRHYRPDFGRLALPRHATAALQTRAESEAAWDAVESAGLPHAPGVRGADCKDWDTLIAFAQIVGSMGQGARVLDAGAELTSALLPWLYLYGYRNLTGINLTLWGRFRRGAMVYEHGDITRTRFANASFDAVACLSVIEHGVPLESFAAEMARVLRPGGRLVVSTDYWNPRIQTADVQERYYKAATGTWETSPWDIFDGAEVGRFLTIAARHRLDLVGDFDPTCLESPVSYFGRDYTYLCLTFVRR